MITRIRNHFKMAAQYRQQIEREKLILDRNKILPIIILDQLPVWPAGVKSTFHRALSLSQMNAGLYRFERMAMGDIDVYVTIEKHVPESHATIVKEFFEHYMANVEKMNGPNSVLAQVNSSTDDIRKAMAEGSFMYLCHKVDDWLTSHEAINRDPDLKRLARHSCYWGDGAEALQFYRMLNAMPDWKSFVEKLEFMGGPPNGRKKKPLPKVRTDLAWQPAGIGSPA